MNKEDFEEIKQRHENKPIIDVGKTYSMFGVTYIACPCADCFQCAFSECQCEYNVDVPRCNNDVHFELIANCTDFEQESEVEECK